MTEKDLIGTMKKQVDAELSEVADKVIEDLVEQFRKRLIEEKYSIVTGLINGVDFLVSQDEIKRDISMQVNVKTENKKQELDELIYQMRTNMTSITRYIRHKREDHPTLTEGQYAEQSIAYKKSAEVAVSNILDYLNRKYGANK